MSTIEPVLGPEHVPENRLKPVPPGAIYSEAIRLGEQDEMRERKVQDRKTGSTASMKYRGWLEDQIRDLTEELDDAPRDDRWFATMRLDAAKRRYVQFLDRYQAENWSFDIVDWES